MATKIKWFPPDKQPLCDALVVTNKGKRIWQSWDGAAQEYIRYVDLAIKQREKQK